MTLFQAEEELNSLGFQACGGGYFYNPGFSKKRYKLTARKIQLQFQDRHSDWGIISNCKLSEMALIPKG